jgi:hypothetical protein
MKEAMSYFGKQTYPDLLAKVTHSLLHPKEEKRKGSYFLFTIIHASNGWLPGKEQSHQKAYHKYAN